MWSWYALPYSLFPERAPRVQAGAVLFCLLPPVSVSEGGCSSSVTRTILATSVTMGLPLCEVEDGDDDDDDDDSFFEAR